MRYNLFHRQWQLYSPVLLYLLPKVEIRIDPGQPDHCLAVFQWSISKKNGEKIPAHPPLLAEALLLISSSSQPKITTQAANAMN
jgi:hypothetical protein